MVMILRYILYRVKAPPPQYLGTGENSGISSIQKTAVLQVSYYSLEKAYLGMENQLSGIRGEAVNRGGAVFGG